VAASKLKALKMVNTPEATSRLVPAKAGTAFEAATLPSYQIKFETLLGYLPEFTKKE